MKTKKNILQFTLNAVSLFSVILLAMMVITSCSSSKKSVKTDPSEEIPYVQVEEMPVFPGGDSTLLAYLAKNTHYPEKAKTGKITGKVIVKFCVTSKGGVNQIGVIKSVSPELDSEATRVVSTLPAFKPGRQGGKDVAVWYMVPIEFALK